MEDIRKAAILISNLDKPLAAQVLSQMPRDLVAAVTLEMAALDNVSREQQDSVLNEFYSLAQRSEATVDRAVDLPPEDIKPKSGDPLHFKFLHCERPETLLNCIVDEHPQTIALIISQLHRPLADDVLAALPASTQREVIGRVENIAQPSPEAIRDVEGVLERRMKSASERSPGISPTRYIPIRPTQHA